MFAAALVILGVRGVKTEFSPQALFTTFEEQAIIDERFAETFGETENAALFVIEAEDVLQRDVLEYIKELAESLQGRDYVDRVESIATSALPRPGGSQGGVGELRVDAPLAGDDISDEQVQELRAALQTSRLFDNTLISESRRVAVIAVFLGDGLGEMAVLLPAMQEMYGDLEARPPPEGVRVQLTGIPHIRVFVVDGIVQDQLRMIPIASVLCLFILWMSFRWWPGVVLPAAAVATTLVFTLAGMSIVGEPINIINNILPVLLIVIGISDAIHLVSRYGEERRDGIEKREAIINTMATMTTACFLTSFTTSIGFASLVVSHTDILRRFGVTCAFAVMIAYGVTILLLPVALTWVKPPPKAMNDERDGWFERVSVSTMRLVLAYPKPVLAVSVFVIGGAIVLGLRVPIDTFLMETFPEDSEVYAQNELLERELNGMLPIEVSLRSETAGRFNDADVLNASIRVQDWLDARYEVLSTRQYADVLRETWVVYSADESKREATFSSRAQVAQLASLLEGGTPDPLAPLVTADRRHMRITAQVRDVGSIAALALVADLRPVLEAEFAEFDDVVVELSGDAYSASRGLDMLIRDMLSSLGLSIFFIFIILTLLFRSIQLGIISVPANAAPLILTLGYMSLKGIHLNTTTVIVFSVSIGLAVDDTIHILARFREEIARGYDLDNALIRTARGAGRAVLVTSIMLMSGLSVILLSSFVPVRLFAELTCITIIGCLFGDLLMLPALLKLFWKRERAPNSATGAHAVV
ncbi:MAG: putative RND superfamily exporter protein [Bradymonadia bacterium]|jgi:predicted RND superfamily exporter protein